MTLHPGAVAAVEVVDLEAGVGSDPLVQLQAGVGAEHDGLAVHAVVDREDERAAVGHHRQAPDLVLAEELQAPVSVEQLDPRLRVMVSSRDLLRWLHRAT